MSIGPAGRRPGKDDAPRLPAGEPRVPRPAHDVGSPSQSCRAEWDAMIQLDSQRLPVWCGTIQAKEMRDQK
jgi:hypothetical protein